MDLMIGQALPRLRTDIKPPKVFGDLFDTVKGKFKDLKKLGQGAFGAAYSAKLGGKSIIVKTAVGHPGIVTRARAIQSMKHETAVLMRLQKFPFVPRLVEIGEDYFVQEDVDGVSLLTMLAQGDVEAKDLLSSIVASGIILSVLHREGVAHNDYAARNILLTPNGVVAIDFGIAILRDSGAAAFKSALEGDIVNLLSDAILAASSPGVPQQIKIMIAETVDKFRDVVINGEADVDTAQELSRELLFAVAQMGARAVRGGKIAKDIIKIRVL